MFLRLRLVRVLFLAIHLFLSQNIFHVRIVFGFISSRDVSVLKEKSVFGGPARGTRSIKKSGATAPDSFCSHCYGVDLHRSERPDRIHCEPFEIKIESNTEIWMTAGILFFFHDLGVDGDVWHYIISIK